MDYDDLILANEGIALEQRNIGSDVTADKLREIAETGKHTGVFGGKPIEAAAQAILKLHKKVVNLEHDAEEYNTAYRLKIKELTAENETLVQGINHLKKVINESTAQWNRRIDNNLELAAKIAETWGGSPPSPFNRRGKLAAAIRKLKLEEE